MPDLPANDTTPIILNRFETYRGSLERVGDRDWIGVRMNAGEWLRFDASRDGTFGLEDPVLRLYDSSGQQLAFNDDYTQGFGGGSDASLHFKSPAAGIYYAEVAAFEDDGQGRYAFQTYRTQSATPLEALDWGTRIDGGDDIAVYFAPPGTRFDGYTSEGFNGYERARFAAAFDLIEAVASVRFTVQDQARGAEFRLVLDLNEDTEEFQAYFNPPGETNAGVGVFDGTQWDRAPGGDLRDGGRGFKVITHELLHGLGLAHPHDDGGSSRQMDGVYESEDDYGAFNLNQGIFTTMSYNEGYLTGTPGSAPHDGNLWGQEIGPMALDIAALQRKYGANLSHAVGDDVYTLPTTNRAGTGWRAIWDTSGVDEIRADPTDTTGVTINLNAATLRVETGGGGFYSGEVGIAGGFTIANGVLIENATGARGDDRLYGTGKANTLIGGGGDDTLVGGGGGDHLQGSGGNDLAIVPFRLENVLAVSDSLQIPAGRLYLTVDAPADRHTVILSSVERVTFGSGETLSLSELAARKTGEGFRLDGDGALTGGDQNDTLAGGAGRDLLDGGAGVDTLVGRGGNDFYIVDNPLDVVREDAAFSEGGGIDTIRAFVDYTQPENVELLRLGNLGDVVNLHGTGNDAPGTLVGNAGWNVLNGRGGNDQINGNKGSDTLIGGVGADTLVGGAGDDVFVYNSISESRAGAANRDVINGFQRADVNPFAMQDRIDLRGIDADTTSFGVDDVFEFIYQTRFSGQAGELRLQSLGGANAVLVEGDVNGDGQADFQIFVNLVTTVFEEEFLL